METLIRLLVFCAWIGVGLLIARKSKRAGSAVLWMVALGPLGILLVVYGEARRSRVGPEPTARSTTEDLQLPVEVEVDGSWSTGVLHTWSTTPHGWFGWVSYTSANGTSQAGWFPDDRVRREPQVETGPASI